MMNDKTKFLGLQKGIVYGPIFSRRLGRDLGINLLSSRVKVCNFDCVYCQYGPSNTHTFQLLNSLIPDSQAILEDILAILKKPYSLDHITFSGNGEPTLHPEFLFIVKEVIKLRDKYKPGIPIALLSNGSNLSRSDVFEAVQLIDKPIFKLDVGNSKTFFRVNRGARNVDFSTLISNYKRIKSIILQTALFSGEFGNIREDEIKSLARIIALINPIAVQLYTIERSYDPKLITPITSSDLQNYSSQLEDLSGVKITAYVYSG